MPRKLRLALMRAVKKTPADAARDLKSAPWKIAIATVMKTTGTATNRWLAEALHMGSSFRVSRLVSACRTAPGTAAPFLRQMANDKA